jgi:hypothetical protein
MAKMTKKQAKNAVKRIRSNLGTITETLMDCPDPYEYPEGKAVVRIVEALDELEAYLK